MMSNFTYAYWPSVCLLWIKVCLDLLHIFHLDFLSFFVIELYDLFVCFGNWTLIGHIICRYFLPVCRLSFHFVYGFLCCAKASICLFLLLILLPWEIDLRKQWYDLCQRMFCLCFLLGVLWCHALYLGLLAILSLFLCMVSGCVLTSLICMQLSNLSSSICWRDCLFPIVYSCLLYRKLIDHSYVGLFMGSLFCSIDPFIHFCSNTMLFWLL